MKFSVSDYGLPLHQLDDSFFLRSGQGPGHVNDSRRVGHADPRHCCDAAITRPRSPGYGPAPGQQLQLYEVNGDHALAHVSVDSSTMTCVFHRPAGNTANLYNAPRAPGATRSA